MRHDLRFAWRQIRSSPAASLIVILTFAIGIGLNTALFSVVDALLLRALPGFETERTVTIGCQHLLESLLFGTRAADPLTLAGVCCGVMLMVVAAAMLPARSAARWIR